MTVYGVWQHDWENDTLLGLYRTRAEADRHAEAHNEVPEIARLRQNDIVLYEHTKATVEEHSLLNRFNGFLVAPSIV